MSWDAQLAFGGIIRGMFQGILLGWGNFSQEKLQGNVQEYYTRHEVGQNLAAR